MSYTGLSPPEAITRNPRAFWNVNTHGDGECLAEHLGWVGLDHNTPPEPPTVYLQIQKKRRDEGGKTISAQRYYW